MNPPKCKTCGKEEWQHVCHGLSLKEVRARVHRELAAMAESYVDAPKKRKEYLRLKAIERRARQKEAREASK